LSLFYLILYCYFTSFIYYNFQESDFINRPVRCIQYYVRERAQQAIVILVYLFDERSAYLSLYFLTFYFLLSTSYILLY